MRLSQLWTRDAQPFGESGNATGPMGYTGQRLDGPTGLYNYRARMYSAALGRFLQPDPAGYAGGNNLYAYVANDPLDLTDPSGMCTLGCLWKPVEHALTGGIKSPSGSIFELAAILVSQYYLLPEFEIAEGIGTVTSVAGTETISTATYFANGAIATAVASAVNPQAGRDVAALTLATYFADPNVAVSVGNSLGTSNWVPASDQYNVAADVSSAVGGAIGGAIQGGDARSAGYGALESFGESAGIQIFAPQFAYGMAATNNSTVEQQFITSLAVRTAGAAGPGPSTIGSPGGPAAFTFGAFFRFATYGRDLWFDVK